MRKDEDGINTALPSFFHLHPSAFFDLLGDFRLRPFGQIDCKGRQDLPNEQIVPDQGRDLQSLLHAKAVPDRIERRIAKFVVTEQLLHIAHQYGLISQKALRRRAVRDGLDGIFGETGLPSQAGMGEEFVLAVDLSRSGKNDGLTQSFGQIQVITHVCPCVGHARCEVRTVQEDTIRPSDTAATVGNGIIKLLVFRF